MTEKRTELEKACTNIAQDQLKKLQEDVAESKI